MRTSTVEVRTITIDNIIVEVTRKKIKNLYLRILPPDGRVSVSAPARIPERQIRQFVQSRAGWIRQKQAEVRARGGQMEPLTAAQRSECRIYMEERVPPLIRKWEPVLDVQVGEWKLRDMKTRWGSCNTRAGRIWLNLKLAEYPPECLEYVVVHEMIHLRVPNHGKDFYQYMDRFLPDWRQRKKQLNSGK